MAPCKPVYLRGACFLDCTARSCLFLNKIKTPSISLIGERQNQGGKKRGEVRENPPLGSLVLEDFWEDPRQFDLEMRECWGVVVSEQAGGRGQSSWGGGGAQPSRRRKRALLLGFESANQHLRASPVPLPLPSQLQR